MLNSLDNCDRIPVISLQRKIPNKSKINVNGSTYAMKDRSNEYLISFTISRAFFGNTSTDCDCRSNKLLSESNDTSKNSRKQDEVLNIIENTIET